jgi:hypothetical protein
MAVAINDHGKAPPVAATPGDTHQNGTVKLAHFEAKSGNNLASEPAT